MADILPPISTAAVSLTGPNAGRMDGAYYGAINRTLVKIVAQINTLSNVVTAISDANGDLITSQSLQISTAELTAITAIQGTGITVRDALGRWYGRSHTNTDSITWTNADGTAGNPTAAISASYPGQTSITTLGTIGTGTWNGTAVAAAFGGTGQTSYTVGDLLYASGATALSKLSAGAATYVLTSNGAGVAPSWQATGSGGSGSGGSTVPLASAFTTVGAGITVTDKSGRLQLSLTTFTGAFRGVMKTLPSTPYTIDLRGQMSGQANASTTMMWGIALSDGTAYRTFNAVLSSGGAGVRVFSWTNATGITGTPLNVANASPLYPDAYLRITDDGTNRRFIFSANGVDFAEIFSEASTAGLTATQCGINAYCDHTGAVAYKLAVRHFLVTGSVLGDAA